MDTEAAIFQEAISSGIIDRKRLAELCELDEGSTVFAASLVEDFAPQIDSFFLDFDTSLNKQDLSGVVRTAHKLKSSLANIAAGRASRACANIEKSVTSVTPIDTVQALIENLKQEILSFLNAVR